MKRTLAILPLSLVSSLSLAQSAIEVDQWIDRWAKENRHYVTKQVREEVPEVRGPTWFNLLSFWIRKYPSIHLQVRPSPPEDYKISINGEDCPPTDGGLYKVLVGSATVRVERMGRPPCSWTGYLEEGRNYNVTCNL